MKCIQLGKVVKRVSNQEAADLVAEGQASYVPKSVYKATLPKREKAKEDAVQP